MIEQQQLGYILRPLPQHGRDHSRCYSIVVFCRSKDGQIRFLFFFCAGRYGPPTPVYATDRASCRKFPTDAAFSTVLGTNGTPLNMEHLFQLRLSVSLPTRMRKKSTRLKAISVEKPTDPVGSIVGQDLGHFPLDLPNCSQFVDIGGSGVNEVVSRKSVPISFPRSVTVDLGPLWTTQILQSKYEPSWFLASETLDIPLHIQNQ